MASFNPANGPGQPQPTDIGVDYICLEWESAERDDVTHYEIRMKLASDESWNNTIIPTEDRRPSHRVDELLQNTGYEFMFRAVYPDGSSSAFSHKSVKITTNGSELRTLLKVCQKIDDGPPGVYRLPLMSVSENTDKKTRKCVFGTSTCLRERTILMVGTNEAGKTTLIEGLVNHCLGVQWEDDFRFAITDETSTHKVCKRVIDRGNWGSEEHTKSCLKKIQYDILKAKYELGVEEKIPADYMLLSTKRAFVSSLEEVISLISETAEYNNDLQGVQQGEKDFMMHMIDREEQKKKPW
ncbi:uncharacterized protein LOC117317506 [Pecten maximus]|uniref:uncharacterized protein LOC117317506 n=1 Tax=Pecten maximus TaxID=6579 RepID=UPI0014582B61|nr:uncharacterized protein LOC117317506 [Pecten maximus]